jgi:superfamily II DNA/RNA helicase
LRFNTSLSLNIPFQGNNMSTFAEFSLPDTLLTTLKRMDYLTPTPIQAASIPAALAGKDVLGSAQTGTGKTAAFSVPMVAHLTDNRGSKALILAPTRELAEQVERVVMDLLKGQANISTALLIGGASILKQLSRLKRKPRVIIGTPGRINDHLERGSLVLDDVDYLVLDEMDRMLDMGFMPQIDRIVKHLPEHQTLMFSATIPKRIEQFANRYMHEPVRVSMGDTHKPTDNIQQEVIQTTPGNKYNDLCKELAKREGSVIIFVKTKHATERLSEKLNDQGFSADAIHGDLRQSKRQRVIERFRRGDYTILVATDVAARGLDIPHVQHVINYDLPQVAEDYIHRIGRTGRAGAKGMALCLLTNEDRRLWQAIERLFQGHDSEVAPSRARPSRPGQRRDSARQPARDGFSRRGDKRTRSYQDRPGRHHEKRASDKPQRSYAKTSDATSAPRHHRQHEREERVYEKRSHDKSKYRSAKTSDIQSGERHYNKRDKEQHYQGKRSTDKPQRAGAKYRDGKRTEHHDKQDVRQQRHPERQDRRAESSGKKKSRSAKEGHFAALARARSDSGVHSAKHHSFAKKKLNNRQKPARSARD